MWPQNIMFFLFPAIVIILVFFSLPYFNRKREPFGYKTEIEIPDDAFGKIKIIYHRKVFLFSIPLTLAISIINMYILSTFLGSILLGVFILTLASVNFIFYIQGYRAARKCLAENPGTVIEQIPETETGEKTRGELPKW